MCLRKNEFWILCLARRTPDAPEMKFTKFSCACLVCTHLIDKCRNSTEQIDVAFWTVAKYCREENREKIFSLNRCDLLLLETSECNQWIYDLMVNDNRIQCSPNQNLNCKLISFSFTNRLDANIFMVMDSKSNHTIDFEIKMIRWSLGVRWKCARIHLEMSECTTTVIILSWSDACW